jgi:8-oxo-dGTP pyrophosphatase MutT (NUDIX family)
MLRLLLIAIFCAWSATQALAEGPAGIILYFKSGNEIYLLLADHSAGKEQGRGWAAFGGASKDGESAEQTAARETEEETRGFFARDWLLEKIHNQTPVRDGVFSCFFLEVDFVPIPRIATRQPPTGEPDFAERGPFAWIPFSQVVPHLGTPSDPAGKAIISAEYLPSKTQTNWFWPIWLQNLRIARVNGVLPWERTAGSNAPVAAGVGK